MPFDMLNILSLLNQQVGKLNNSLLINLQVNVSGMACILLGWGHTFRETLSVDTAGTTTGVGSRCVNSTPHQQCRVSV
jgi:hypothetical protein